MAFDIEGARSAGYSDAEIADFLGKDTGFDVLGARRAGYEPSEIVAHLSGLKKPARPDIPASDPMGSGFEQATAPRAERQRSVMEGYQMREQAPPSFDAQEALKLSDRTYAESTMRPSRKPNLASMQSAPEVKSRGFTGAIADAGLGFAQGSIGLAKGVADNLIAGENPISNYLESVIKTGDKAKSDEARQALIRRDFDIYAAQKNGGEAAAAKVAFDTLLSNPVAGLDVVARGVGSLAPTLAMGGAGAGMRTMATVNALSNAGDAASQTYDQLKAIPERTWFENERYADIRKQGASHEQAIREVAPAMALGAQAVGALTGAVSGNTGLERALAGKAAGNAVGQRVGRAAAEIGGEQLETLVPQLAGNLTANAVDGETSAFKDIGRASVDTLAGTLPGAAMAARRANAQNSPKSVPLAPPIDPIGDIAQAQSTDEAIAAAAQATQSSSAVDKVGKILEQNQQVGIINSATLATENVADGSDIATISKGIIDLEAVNEARTEQVNVPAATTETAQILGIPEKSKAPAPLAQAITETTKTPEVDVKTEAAQPSPKLGEQVSFYSGKYSKGMGKDAAKLEAMRLNSKGEKNVTYAAEEHNNPKLENPYAVVGRKVVSPKNEPTPQSMALQENARELPKQDFDKIPKPAPEQQQDIVQGIGQDVERLYQQDVKDGIKERMGLIPPPEQKTEKRISYAESPFLKQFAEQGGIDIRERGDTGIDGKRLVDGNRTMPNPYNIGGLPLYRKGGMRGDALVQSLVSQGYLTQQAVDAADAGGVGGSEQLAYDLIKQELTNPGSVRQADDFTSVAKQFDDRARNELYDQAERLGVDIRGLTDQEVSNSVNRAERRSGARGTGTFADRKAQRIAALQNQFADDFDFDAINALLDAPSNMSTEDAMLMLGFTNQEIQDAINKESTTTPTDGQRSSATDEGIARGQESDTQRGDGGQTEAGRPANEAAIKGGVSEYIHNGVRIYPIKIAATNGAEPAVRWAVESSDNKARRESGDRNRGGDTLHNTIEEAKKAADFETKQDQQEKSRLAGIAEKEQAEKNAAEVKREANKGKSLAEIKAQGYMAQIITDGQTGENIARSEWVKKLIYGGSKPSVEMVNRIKPLSRAAYHRATNEVQAAHEKKIREGGKVQEYSIGDYIVSKTEFDFAQSIAAEELTSPSKQDVLDQQDRATAAQKLESQAKQDADKAAKDADERKRIAKASEAAADTFELGGNALDNLTGQKDIFSEPAAQAATILNAANITGKERLDVLKDVKAGTLTAEEVKEAYPVKADKLPADDLNAMFDDIMAETAPVPRQSKSKPRTAVQAASSAAVNTAAALGNTIDGLGALFGAKSKGRLGSGLSFDEETYAQAKPLFIQAIGNLKSASADIREAMRTVINMVTAKFGRATAENMKPYIVRFASDVRDGTITQEELNVPSTDASVESNSTRPSTEQAMGDIVSDDSRGVTDGAGKTGGQAARSDGRGQSDGTSVSPSSAATDGERSDQLLRGGREQARPASSDARTDFGERSGDSGITGVPPETIAAKQVADVATSGDEDIRARSKQSAASKLTVKTGDLQNVRDTLPYLLPAQQEDVYKAESIFSKPDGYGMLFTNGTGTGKTFTGLGVVKRFAMQGKTNTIILVPDGKIASDWIRSGKALGLDIAQLKDTKESGNGIVLTTYANMGANDSLAKRQWDLIISDEAHGLVQNDKGKETGALANLRAISHHPDGINKRFAMTNRKALEKEKSLSDWVTKSEKVLGGGTAQDKLALKEAQKELSSLSKQLADLRQAEFDKNQAMQGVNRPRVVFLSATPFAYEKTVDWANGYLFDYMDGYPYDIKRNGLSYNQPDPFQYFMMTRFGYTMRVNKLTAPGPKVDSGLMQRQFNGELKKKGVLSGRMLDVKPDYDRRFVLIDSAIGNKIDEALEWLGDKAQEESASQEKIDRPKRAMGMAELASTIKDQFDYLSRRYLLEGIKAEAVIPIVKQHLAIGRKVVVFHDYNKGGSTNPFAIPQRIASADSTEEGQAKSANFNKALAQFNAEFPELVTGLNDLLSPIELFKKELPQTMLINGLENTRDLLSRYLAFQDDTNGPQVMLVQSDKNKGWSGHDTTGKHQRVLINLGQPTAPTKAIQQEGRIYRTGQASDAIMRYLNTGTSWERWAFATTIATRSSTAENLGMGEQARALKDSFIAAFEESDTFAPGHEGEGTGGKARDKANNAAITEYDRAKSFYYGTAKKNSKTKAQEGADYFATPEPIGLKMVEWLDARSGEDLLEPSGGHGAIARWMPEKTKKTVIEPSANLRSRMALVLDMESSKMLDGTFEELNVVNKFDGIAMNPPFGSGGKTAIDHLAKAATHLRDGGRIVALIPMGPAADKKFDNWFYGVSEKPVKPLGGTGKHGPIYRGDTVTLEGFGSSKDIVAEYIDGPASGAQYIRAKDSKKDWGINTSAIVKVIPTGPRFESFRVTDDLYMVANIKLPQVTFERAGTAVATRIVVIEKQLDKNNAPDTRNTQDRDLTGIDDINELFDRLENVALPSRAKVDQVEPETPKLDRRNSVLPKASKPIPSARSGSMITLGNKEYPVETYTTNAGKALRGVWVESRQKALSYGASTFQKSGKGFFVRERDFPKADDAPMFSRATESFYSALSREVATINAKAQSEEGWRLNILGLVNKGKVKADEVEWSGVNEWLKLQTGKVTKEQVTEYLDANGVQVQETLLADKKSELNAEPAFYEKNDNGQWQVYGYEANANDVFGTESEAKNKTAFYNKDVPDAPTKYSQYQLAGGENYREVLLTLPTKPRTSPTLEQLLHDYNALTENYTNANNERMGDLTDAINTEREKLRVTDEATWYKSSHWNQANVLAHIRLNDRTDADGKRVLFVEEAQSDWGQDGKKKGFTTEGKLPNGWDVVEQPTYRYRGGPKDGTEWMVYDNTKTQVGFGSQTREGAILSATRPGALGGVPVSPFVTATDKWLSLALKRVIKIAVDEGYDKVAFINGEQSADRYDLSKTLSELVWVADGNRGTIVGLGLNGETLISKNATPDELPDIIGKEVAKRLLDQPVKNGEQSLAEDGLKVGGEGMKKFYDSIVPNTANALLKKLGGGQMESIQIGKTFEQYLAGRGIEVRDGKMLSSGTEMSAGVVNRQYKEEYPDGTLTPTGFTITPAMREKAAGGLPMFSQGQPTGNMTVESIQNAVDEITGAWVRKPDIYVLKDMSEAPDRVRNYWEQQNAKGATGGVEGFHYNNSVYLLADALNSQQDVARVLFHEALGHYGLRNVFGDSLKSMLKEVAAMLPKEMAKKAEQYGINLSNEKGRMQAAEEVLAELAQTRPEMGLVKRAIAAIRTWLRENIPGFKNLRTTDAEIINNYILPARAWVERGRDAATSSGMPALSRKKDVEIKHGWNPKNFQIIAHRNDGTTEKFDVRAFTSTQDGGYREGYGTAPMTLTATTESNSGFKVNFKISVGEYAHRKSYDDHEISIDGALGGRSAYSHFTLNSTNPSAEFSRKSISQTDTPAFKAWFGDSVVTDTGKAGGKPLVVYHGTTASFSEFDPNRAGLNFGGNDTGIYFTSYSHAPNGYGDDTSASRYAESGGKSSTGANVMPVYLSFKNPLVIQEEMVSGAVTYADINRTDLRRWMSGGNHDGIIIQDTSSDIPWAKSSHETVYIAFKPTQIKSATGNNGSFDPANPDIRFSRAFPSLSATPNTWSVAETGRSDAFVHMMQDSRTDLKSITKSITQAGGKLVDAYDGRLNETLYAGRVDQRTKAFLNGEGKALEKALADSKVTLNELGDYLHARGARERNAQIAKINDSMPDGGAGSNSQGLLLTNKAAADYLRAIAPAQKAVLDRLAALVDGITAGTRTLLVAEGLEKQSTIDAWTTAYKNYVPMFRDEAEAGTPHPTGAGFTVKGSASKRAMGSTKEATNIVAHVLMQREAAITRAEKNRVALSLYGMALQNPNPEFWVTIKPGMSTAKIDAELTAMGVDTAVAMAGMDNAPTIRTIVKEAVLDANGLKVLDSNGKPMTKDVAATVANPGYKNFPGAITVKVNGEDRVLMLNVKQERGERLAASLKNLDGLTAIEWSTGVLHQYVSGKIPPWVGVAPATRWIASVNTQYNPAFGVVNFTRDAMGAAVNLNSTELKDDKMKVLWNSTKALKGIGMAVAGKGKGGKWEDLYAQFVADGGQTGYKEMFRDANDRAKEVEKRVKRLQDAGKLTAGNMAHGVLDVLDGFNTVMENAVRLSAYSAALDKGMTRPQAARLARELTVDFNRKGVAGRELGPMYAFFNASVQGTARTLETMRSQRGLKIIAGGIGLGVLQALMLAAMGYDDDEISEYVKARSLVIPTGKNEKGEKTHVLIPLPLGLHVLPNTGRIMAELVLGGGKDWQKRSVSAIGEMAGAFNPVGGGSIFTADGLLKTVAPTVIDPIIEMGFNKNFAGGAIQKEGFKDATDSRPGYAKARESTQRKLTGQAYVGISKAMNSMLGGTQYEAASIAGVKVSPTPEMIHYVAQVVGGGVLREIEKSIDSIHSASKGENVKSAGLPVLGRFHGETDEKNTQTRRFIEGRNETNKLESVYKSIKKSGDDAALDAFVKENPSFVYAPAYDDIQSKITKLNKLAVTVIEDDATMKEIDADRLELMRNLNKKIQEAEKERGEPTPKDWLQKLVDGN